MTAEQEKLKTNAQHHRWHRNNRIHETSGEISTQRRPRCHPDVENKVTPTPGINESISLKARLVSHVCVILRNDRLCVAKPQVLLRYRPTDVDLCDVHLRLHKNLHAEGTAMPTSGSSRCLCQLHAFTREKKKQVSFSAK